MSSDGTPHLQQFNRKMQRIAFLVLVFLALIFPEIQAGEIAVQTRFSAPAPWPAGELLSRSESAKPHHAFTARPRPAPYRIIPADITAGNPRSTKVAITFDGGINGREAAEILDVLKKRRIKVTMFLTGGFINRYPGVTRRIVREGHEVGNHMLNHPHLTEYRWNYTQKTLGHVTREFVVRELKAADMLFQRVTGRRMAPLWRAPYGEINGEIRRWAFSAGYLHVGWTNDFRRHENLDSLDWVYDRSSSLYLTPEEIKRKILGFRRGRGGPSGGIVLMHLGTERKEDRASKVLGEILDGLIARGYSIVKVSELIEDRTLLKAAQRNREMFDRALRIGRLFKGSGS